jgi:phage terminase large subunit-like protein
MEKAGKPLELWQREGVDLMLSYRGDGRWACYEYAEWVARQNGKGGLGEARALTGFFVLGEELITWTAHEYKTSHEAFRRMKALMRYLGKTISDTLIDVDGVLIKISNGNEESFERLDTGQRIIFIARTKSSGRGFSGDVVIIDEAFAYTPEQAEALGPTMIARPNAQIIYLSSPPLTGDTGEVMFELKKRAEAGGDDSLGYRDWGIKGSLDELSSVDIDDPKLWALANPALGLGRVSQETIQRLRRMLSAREGRGFAREVLGLWPRQVTGGGAIDLVQWAALLKGDSRYVGDVAIGVDISPKRDYAAIAIYGLRADGLGHGQIVTYKPGVDWLMASTLEWRTAKNPVGVGMGRTTHASLEAELEKADVRRPAKEDEPCYGDLAVLNATEMTAATGQILDAVKQATFRHIGQHELDASVAGAKTKETNEATVWARKDADADTAPLVALTIARYVFETRAHLVQNANYDVLDSVF